MADNYTIRGTQIVWGVKDSYGSALVQSVTRSKGAKTKELLDATGETAALAVYDKNETVTVTAIVTSTESLIEVGTDFTLGSDKFTCTSCEIAWANEDGAKITIQGRTYGFTGGNT